MPIPYSASAPNKCKPPPFRSPARLKVTIDMSSSAHRPALQPPAYHLMFPGSLASTPKISIQEFTTCSSVSIVLRVHRIIPSHPPFVRRGVLPDQSLLGVLKSCGARTPSGHTPSRRSAFAPRPVQIQLSLVEQCV